MLKSFTLKWTVWNDEFLMNQIGVKNVIQIMFLMGRGGGQVVSMLAFYSDDPSSNLTYGYIFFCKFVFEKYENR